MGKTDTVKLDEFFAALADRTRLRLLNLMRGGEVCVCFFAETIGTNNPKISRHLSYLKRAGLVKGRRDGKWMHYSIAEPDDEGGRRVLRNVLEWLDDRPELRAERERYNTVCCTPELLVQIARTPMNFALPSQEEDQPEKPAEHQAEPEYAYRESGHNEIEEFLL